MKRYLVVPFVALFLFSCGGGSDSSDEVNPVENTAPSVPALVAPANNLLCIDNAVVFQWNTAVDAESDAVSYLIQISKDVQFSTIDYTNSITTLNKTISLEKGMRYYWRVKAVDSKNLSSAYSAVFQFYTEGTGMVNHLPFVPSLIKPELASVTNAASVVLEWAASDVDSNDQLTYDVYFGTTNPPTEKVASSQSLKTFTQSLNSAANYYWRVDVKDDKGGFTKGQVWNFKKN